MHTAMSLALLYVSYCIVCVYKKLRKPCAQPSPWVQHSSITLTSLAHNVLLEGPLHITYLMLSI